MGLVPINKDESATLLAVGYQDNTTLWPSMPGIAHKPILMVTLPGICKTFKSIIKDMSFNIDFTIIELLDPNHYNLTNDDLKNSTNKPEQM